MTRILALVATILLGLPAFAHEVTVGDLTIVHPHIPQPAKTAKAAGGFMAIINEGIEADRLIGIESTLAAKTELHESRVDANGVGTMDHVEGIDIPAGATVGLEHGGYHVMFMGLTGPLAEGEMHKATLVFETAGRVEIEFMVDPPVGQGGAVMDHSAMGHDAPTE